MNKIGCVLVLLCCTLNLYAQDIEVKKFEPMEKDRTATLSPRKDINGTVCGLVKVQLKEPGAEFEGNVMGDVQFTGNEYLVYLPNGTKRLGIKHPDYLPITIVFADYGIKKIVSGTTYELKVKTNKKKAKVDNSKKGMAVFNIKPSNAMLLIDGQIADGSGGAYTLSLPYGTHYYTVKLKDFSINNQSVKIDKNAKTVNVDLTEYFADVKINCQDQDAEIRINGEFMGMGKWSGLLVPGNCVIDVNKKGYHPQSKTIELQENDVTNCDFSKLKMISGVLQVSYEPKGCDVIIDGKKIGETPLKKELPVGEYTLIVKKEMYNSYETKMNIFDGQELLEEGSLKPTELQKLILSAESGEPFSQACLADLYYYGSAVLLQDTTYWEYVDIPIAVDPALAQKEGVTIKKDITKCIEWLKKAISIYEKNDENLYVQLCSNQIMNIYLLGEGVKQDFNQSFYWAKKAKDNYWLAWHYFYGRGVGQSNSKAISYINNMGLSWLGLDNISTISSNILNKVANDIPRIKEVLDVIGYK